MKVMLIPLCPNVNSLVTTSENESEDF